MQPDWLETKAAALIAAARKSKFRREIFADADQFIRQGYAKDVALAMAIDYWLWSPMTPSPSNAA